MTGSAILYLGDNNGGWQFWSLNSGAKYQFVDENAVRTLATAMGAGQGAVITQLPISLNGVNQAMVDGVYTDLYVAADSLTVNLVQQAAAEYGVDSVADALEIYGPWVLETLGPVAVAGSKPRTPMDPKDLPTLPTKDALKSAFVADSSPDFTINWSNFSKATLAYADADVRTNVWAQDTDPLVNVSNRPSTNPLATGSAEKLAWSQTGSTLETFPCVGWHYYFFNQCAIVLTINVPGQGIGLGTAPYYQVQLGEGYAQYSAIGDYHGDVVTMSLQNSQNKLLVTMRGTAAHTTLSVDVTVTDMPDNWSGSANFTYVGA